VIVITDSNIIISALISLRGNISKIFKAKSKIQFFAPKFIFTEIEKHFEIIEKNSSLNNQELKKELAFLKSRISIISEYDIPKKHVLKAIAIVQDIDIDDVWFVALNRYLHHKIWTLDKLLIKGVTLKGYNIFVNTQDLLNKLYTKKLK
jgi:predicted nucleic acid-binding protein